MRNESAQSLGQRDDCLVNSINKCVCFLASWTKLFKITYEHVKYTEWRTKCHTIDCTHNTFLFLQKHLTSDTKLILIGWKTVPNESL